jgi:hypothetical protein
MMADNTAGNRTGPGGPSPDEGHRRPRQGRGTRPAHLPAAPDLAATAQEAVVRFLGESAAATSGAEPGRAAATAVLDRPAAAGPAENSLGAAVGAGLSGGPGAPGSADSVAAHAAAMSVATLDKMESMAAKLETDITFALQAQAELQAGAGVAAAAAVQAAEESWRAAQASVEAESKVRVHLRVISRNLVFTVVLAVIAIVILAIFTANVH